MIYRKQKHIVVYTKNKIKKETKLTWFLSSVSTSVEVSVCWLLSPIPDSPQFSICPLPNEEPIVVPFWNMNCPVSKHPPAAAPVVATISVAQPMLYAANKNTMKHHSIVKTKRNKHENETPSYICINILC